MKLAKGPFFQMLLSCGYIMTSRQICYHLFPNPTTWQESRFGIGETPLEIDDHSIVRALRA